jgi:Ca-activated chloride channel family protein
LSFQWPLALIGLVAVPVVIALVVQWERRRTKFAARFGNPALLPNLMERAPRWRRHLPLAALLLGLTTMVVGMARPHATLSVKREEATVVLAFDISRSMKATDIRPNRLAAAKEAAQRFVEQVPEKYRIAIVTFGTHAVVGLPPTEDRGLVRAELRSLQPGDGTALGDAIVLAARLGSRERTADGAVPPTSILLISDGAQDGGRTPARVAAQRARALHVPIYGILIGTDAGVVHDRLPGGLPVILRVPPSAPTMRMLTSTTGGELFTATNDARLKDVYTRLGSRIGHRNESREVSNYFAAGSAGLLLLGGALSSLWFRRIVL